MSNMKAAAIFVEAQQVPQALEFASYITKYLGQTEESAAFFKEAEGYAKVGNPVKLYALLVRYSGALLNAPDKEFEGAYNLLLALFKHVPEEARASHMKNAVQIITESDGVKVALKLKVLSNLYNTVAVNSPLRYDVFAAILTFADKWDELDKLVSYLPDLKAWMQDWGVTAEQRRDLVLAVSEKFITRGYTKESYKLLLQHIKSPEDAIKFLPITRRTVALALSTPSIHSFDELATLPAVQQLQKSAEKNDKTLSSLLNIFLNGDLAAYKTFAKSNASFFKAVEVDQEETARKMKLFTIAELGTRHLNVELPYSEVASAVDVEEDEVELWIIEGKYPLDIFFQGKYKLIKLPVVIREGLLEAKMNQLNQTVTITRSTHRTFGPEEWEQLGSKLHAWKSSLAEILAVTANAKLIVTGGQAVASTNAETAVGAN